MPGDAQIDFRVTRLENDVTAIYQLITDIRSTQDAHSRSFDGIDRRLDGMDQRFDGIDRRLDGMDQRFDGIDNRLDGMDQRFDSLEATLAEVVRRLPEPS
jgi:archaellum component FlaC